MAHKLQTELSDDEFEVAIESLVDWEVEDPSTELGELIEAACLLSHLHPTPS